MSENFTQQYDNALLGILQQEGNIERLLNVFFGFLMRRTDFYYPLTQQANRKIGFPDNVAMNLVIKTFLKYQSIFKTHEKLRNESSGDSQPTKTTEESKESKNNDIVDNEKQVVNVKTDTSGKTNSESYKDGEDKVLPNTTDKSKHKKSAIEISDNLTPEERRRALQANSESYNGDFNELYSWTQKINDLEVFVTLPYTGKSAKDLDVKIEKKRLFVGVKENGNVKKVLDSTLSWDVKTADSWNWTFSKEEQKLHLFLDKCEERWWTALFVGDKQIDTNKLDCSRPMNELDDSSQAKIEQLMYDEHQKRQGKLTSSQENTKKLLEEALKKDDSPFKGTGVDVSDFNLC